MNTTVSLVIASILGFVSGVSHGAVSHYQNLPFSLADQVLESFDDSRYN